MLPTDPGHPVGDPVGSPPCVPALPPPRFGHLAHLTHRIGMWEHAKFLAPRTEHGFCTDDNARALIVVARDGGRSAGLDVLGQTYLRFVLDARTTAGRFRNRRDQHGAWLDEDGSDDAQGRAWWSLGVAARHGVSPSARGEGAAAFDACTTFESVHLRANAFAALGAVDLLAVDPAHGGAMQLLHRCVDRLAAASGSRIPWFEERLTYDNARLPEALLAAGQALDAPRLRRTGLRLLTWLVGVETRGDHFSFVPAGGWTPGEPRPGFDQQPVEAVAMAEACHRAWTITGQEVWRTRGLRAAGWFVGRNDTGAVLYDADTGGTCDGLRRDGVNENRGAESTLAGLAALQVAAAFVADDAAVTAP